MAEPSWYDLSESDAAGSQFLRGLLGAVGGIASRHKAGNILLSGIRGGVLGAREGVQDDGTEGGGGYLEALLNVPAGWGYVKDPDAGKPAAPMTTNPLASAFGSPSSPLGYLSLPGMYDPRLATGDTLRGLLAAPQDAFAAPDPFSAPGALPQGADGTFQDFESLPPEMQAQILDGLSMRKARAKR